MSLVQGQGIFPRRYHRVPSDMPIEFNIVRFRKRNLNHLSEKKAFGDCRDLGEDGLSFVSPLNLPTDMLLRIKLSLPGLDDERVLARVVRSCQLDSRYLIAVQFFNFQGHRREKIRAFIAEETKKDYRFLKYL